MNKYYISAIILFIISITAIATIWIVDISNLVIQEKIEFSLKLIRSIGTISTIIFTFLGKIQVKKSKSPSQKLTVKESLKLEIDKASLLSKQESTEIYLTNLESFIDEDKEINTKHIKLSGEKKITYNFDDFEIFQNFEWLKKE